MTGEGAALTTEKLITLTKECRRIIGDRVPLAVGVLEAGARRTVETAKMLEDCGADVLSTTVPYAPPAPDQERILEHFAYITSHTQLPWMVYGNSGCFVNITPATMGALARMPGICAIKDTRPDFEGHLKNLMAVRGSGTTLLCGGEYLVGPGLLYGADGNISGATNLFPRLFVQLYEDAKAGKVREVQEASEKIARIHAMTGQKGVGWLAVFKYAASRMGLMQPWCCEPFAAPDADQRKAIDAILEQFL